ncbi:MAG: hypothetical protein Kow0049_13830 [Stanieria sp.]
MGDNCLKNKLWLTSVWLFVYSSIFPSQLLATDFNTLASTKQSTRLAFNQIKPEEYLAWYNQGNLFLTLKQYQQAIAAYNHALLINPKYEQAWNNRGAAFEGLKQTNQALESYNQALQINPNYQTPINNRHRLLTQRK